MTNPRPVSESSWQGESGSAVPIFVQPIFDVSFLKTSQNKVSAKIGTAGFDLPQRAVFAGYLDLAVLSPYGSFEIFFCFLAIYKLKTITYRFQLGNVVRKQFSLVLKRSSSRTLRCYVGLSIKNFSPEPVILPLHTSFVLSRSFVCSDRDADISLFRSAVRPI